MNEAKQKKIGNSEKVKNYCLNDLKLSEEEVREAVRYLNGKLSVKKQKTKTIVPESEIKQ